MIILIDKPMHQTDIRSPGVSLVPNFFLLLLAVFPTSQKKYLWVFDTPFSKPEARNSL